MDIPLADQKARDTRLVQGLLGVDNFRNPFVREVGDYLYEGYRIYLDDLTMLIRKHRVGSVSELDNRANWTEFFLLSNGQRYRLNFGEGHRLKTVVRHQGLVTEREENILDTNEPIISGFSPLSWNSIAPLIGENKVQVIKDTLNVSADQAILLPTIFGIKKISALIPSIPNFTFNLPTESSMTFDVGAALCVLSYLPGYSAVIQEYLMHPDDCVRVDDVAWYTRFFGVYNGEYRVCQEVSTLARNTAFMILMMLYKTVPRGDDARVQNHISAFLSKRTQSMLSSIGGRPETSTVYNSLVTIEDMVAVPSAVASMPRLKSVVMNAILNSVDPINEHSKLIIKNASASVYSFVVEMITGVATALHFNSTFLIEAERFWARHQTLIRDYGDHWPYYKALDGTGQRTSMTDFNRLAHMAIAWCAVHKPRANDSLKNIEGYTIKEAYKREARHVLRGELAAFLNQDGIAGLIRRLINSGVPLQIDLATVDQVDLANRETMFVEIDD